MDFYRWISCNWMAWEIDPTNNQVKRYPHFWYLLYMTGFWGSKFLVISFFNKGQIILLRFVLLIFLIYVMNKNWSQDVLIISDHNFFHTNCHFCSSLTITKPQKTQTRVLSRFLNKLKLTHFLRTGQKTFLLLEIFLIFTVSMN